MPWAKLLRDCEKGRGESCRLTCACKVKASLSLVGHSADVAAVMQALLRRPVIAARLARLLDRAALCEVDIARLALLAALHDLGKINLGFQQKPFKPARKSAGHIQPLISLLDDRVNSAPKKIKTRLWTDGGLGQFKQLVGNPAFDAVLAHHGSLPDPANADPGLWQADGGYDPIRGCKALTTALLEWFPDNNILASIPSWPWPFLHAFAGLVMLADWIASDARRFELSGAEAPDGIARFEWARNKAGETLIQIGLDSTTWIDRAKQVIWTSRAITGHELPSPAQSAMLDLPAPPETGRICLIEDETGSGKTEAALVHFLDLFRKGAVEGLYFALPTRSAAAQIHGRIECAAKRLLGDDVRVILAVPGYDQIDHDGAAVAGADGTYPDPAGPERRDSEWAAEHPKRYLASFIAVGTIDQALMGALRLRHAQMRSSALLRSLLVVDEVHASDPYMTTILRNLLAQHRRAGGHALLMSATLGATARADLLGPVGRQYPPGFAAACETPYPATWVDTEPLVPLREKGRTRAPGPPTKTVRVTLCPDWANPAAIAARAAAAAREGAQVLVIRNTVRDVVATQLALEACAPDLSLRLAGADGIAIVCPHHARYAPEDRLRLDRALEDVLGRKAPRQTGSVTVASQTAEQSLDIDADFLVTDLCPADVLLQRLGRLHRHKRDGRPPNYRETAACVLAPSEDELLASIRDNGEVGNPPLALGLVYPDLTGVVATRRELETRPSITIPCDNRAFVEAATHRGYLAELAAKIGGRMLANWMFQGGASSAQVQAAEGASLRWDRPIGSACEPGEHIVTRLGLDDRRIVLPENTPGAFGTSVGSLTVPGRWLRGIPADAPTDVQLTGTALVLRIQDRHFVYDRLGLRPRD